MPGRTMELATPPASVPLDPREFRRALGSFATGVTVITTSRSGGEPVGLTANSFSSVSLDPPLVLWSLSLKSPSLRAFEEAGHFAVNVLAEDQVEVSRRFSTPLPDKFDGVQWHRGVASLPLIDGTLARLECQVTARHVSGDHVIFIGQVQRFAYESRAPLVFCQGRYMCASQLQE
jgi:flavin reductase (DIM6/NTAB) family NADH-FMN oxidoreductase RutF